MAYLELKNVCKSYGSGDTETKVLDNINLTIEEGEFVAIVGFYREWKNDTGESYQWPHKTH